MKKLTRLEMGIFAAGDMFGGGAQLIISFYYLIFLTDVVKISPALAGTVVLLARIWDAVSDPLMGGITDNTRSRWGRRKPYFFAGFFAVMAAFLLLWYPISGDNEMMKFAYVLFSYIFYSTVSTMVMVPYAAMSSEISQDYEKRNTVNGARLFFSQLSSLICAVVPLEIVKAFPDVRTGYMAMALFFGVFFAIPFMLMFFFTHERVPMSKEKTKIQLKDFLAPFKIKAFRYLILMYLFAFLAMDVVSTVFAYYMNYYLNRPLELNYVLGAMLITQILLIPAVVAFSNRIGKARTFMYSAVIWMVASLTLGLQSPALPGWTIYANAVFIGVGLIGCIVLPWVMYPDVTDVGEFYAGKRNAGAFGGIMTFMRKFSAAIGIFIVSNIIQFSGYVKPTTEIINGATASVLQTQPDTVILALRIIVVGIPLILLIVAVWAAKQYPLDRGTHSHLLNYLKFQRGEVEENPLTEEELAAMSQRLIG